MEQRDSLEHTSSENLVLHPALNGSAHNAGKGPPISRQIAIAPQLNSPNHEDSPVVDSVLQSDVSLMGGYFFE